MNAVKLVLLTLISCACVLCPGVLGAQTGSARPRIGLALSGGGAKGFSHIGVLKVLEEAGAGVTLGWHSPIGPLEYTVSYGNRRSELLNYVNVGYRF
ncbi:MAG: hypothetical protein FVQ81_06185 [Candidatus Glassbacteria bacterium]|nr:hypothetical protein [Candidatus Glassbacteria bacterium]